MKRRVLAVVFGIAGVAGCSSILGDFDVVPGGGPDASVPVDATMDSPVRVDGNRPDSGPLTDAPPPPQDTGGCIGSDAACSLGSCVTGNMLCSGGTQSCQQTGTVPNGTSCGDAAVCNNGTCGACAGGTDCSDAGSCQKRAIDCTSGTGVCSAMGNQPNGTQCGTNMYCDNGTCAPCTQGSSCNPGGNVCQTGTTQCSGGMATCTNPTNVANGTSCGQNMVCHNGACNSCTQGASCPTGNPCTTGTIDCSSGVANCVPANVTDGTGCGGTAVCCSGTCASCNTPANATSTCSGTTCGYTCNANFSQCNNACVDYSTDSNNCGGCGHSCLGATCGGGYCTPTLLGRTILGAGNGGGIAVGPNAVFVTDSSSAAANVESCPLAGCPGGVATRIFGVTNNAAFERIVFDPGTANLYFTADNTSTVYAMNQSGGVLFTVSAGSPYGIDFDSANIYIGTFDGLAYVPKTGGTPTTITSAYSYTRGVAYDPGTGVVWGADPNPTPTLLRCTLGGACTTWTGPAFPGYYDVHVVNGVPWYMDQSDGLWRCASDTDCSTANATHISASGAQSFTHDGRYVYFPGQSGDIYACSVNGCTGVTQVTSNGGSQGFAITTDPNFVYWLTYTGNIYRVAKL